MGDSRISRLVGDRQTRLRRRVDHYNDPSFGPRTRTSRRRYVVLGLLFAIGITLLAVAVTAVLQGYVNLGLSLPVSIGIWWWWLDRVRVSGRGLTELPPEVLDEREQAARTHAYERAYRLVVIGFAGVIALAVVDRIVGLDPSALFVVGLAGVLLALAAPAVVLAWSEPSEAPADTAVGA